MNKEKSVALIDQEVKKEDILPLSKEEEENVKIIEKKLSNHPVKTLGKLLNPRILGTVGGILKKYLKTQQFLNDNIYKVELKLVTVHTGIWRFIPDFAIQVPEDLKEKGRMHLALQIGSRIIDWSESSLVNIRSVESCQAVILDQQYSKIIFEGSSEEDLKNLLTSISKVIIDWSVTKTYKKDKVDTYQFVEAILAHLKIDYKQPEALVKFFKDMGAKKGPEKSFKCPINNKKMKFKNHTQLDDYVLDMKEKHSDFETKYPDEWKTLQCYDRHFWCGITVCDPEKYPEDDKPSSKGCPFLKPLFEKYLEGGILTKKKSNVIKKKNLK
eukprot:TRINITY_DN7686_c0_g1_i1.p1 TRINITY_DN7686_c0_g1~~TRINITY_DN7686_c0_g1_i1.p1  ORF type:complete len:327 (+),score=73.07 TRINITY_DN7686_c0_g1_i1:29-1009(+)